MKKRLFVIDGHALCYRAYFAFIKNPLINSRGLNTSAIFGFARMLYKLIDEQKPDYLVVAFDPPVKSFRFAMYPEYKANRQKMPDDLRSQIDEIRNMTDVLGITTLMMNDYEADDILGTLARRYSSKNCEVVLVTGDKDALQCVSDNVRVYANRKGITEFDILDRKGVIEKTGIPPENIIDYLALMGDASDNVPGVKGVGEKTALNLVKQYGNIDSIYGRLDELAERQRQLLEAGREMAYLSRDLVTIRTDIDIDFPLETAVLPDFYSQKARDYFTDLEMTSILRDYFPAEDKSSEQHKTKKPAVESGRDYRIIRTEQELSEVIAEINNAGFVSVDTETTSVSPMEASLVGMSLSLRNNQGWYISLLNRSLFSEEYPDPERALALLKPVLENNGVRKIGQNIKYDYIVLACAGIRMQGIYFDTMIASYLLEPGERRHNLDELASHYLNYTTITYKELTGTGKNAIPIWEVPIDRLAEYAIEDADIALRLYHVLKDELPKQNLMELFTSVEMPLLEVLAAMEMEGVRIDSDYFRELSVRNEKSLQAAIQRINSMAGGPFNINSTRELSSILFDRLGLKPVKKTKTGFSTDISVLEALKGQHPIIDELISYRTLSKLRTTYIETLPGLVNGRTGRIHTSYNQTVVATGRLSSSDPNLQNIPAREQMGREIRRGFIADRGFVFMSADYSQIELRLTAHLSGDANMIRAFREGMDIHNLTASSVFGVSPDAVEPDMRRQAKIINFATIYGVSPYGLSQQADIGIREAAAFIEKYFETYPGVRSYVEKTVAFAREHGYVETMLGRRRFIPEINSTTSFRREGSERIAINTPIQGTSADMIKIAMVNIQKIMIEKRMRSRMIMQVHDELVFEVADKERDDIHSIVCRLMENALQLDVPVIVDVGWGKNWEEAH